MESRVGRISWFIFTNACYCAIHAIATFGIYYFITKALVLNHLGDEAYSHAKGGPDWCVREIMNVIDSLIFVQALVFFAGIFAVIMVFRRKYLLAFTVSGISMLILDMLTDSFALVLKPDVYFAVKYAFPAFAALSFMGTTMLLEVMVRKRRVAPDNPFRFIKAFLKNPGQYLLSRNTAVVAAFMSAVFGFSAIAAVSAPRIFPGGRGGNQTSAMGTLKAISAGQEQFRSSSLVDADGDGIGEYGFLVELSGNQNCRLSDIGVSNSPFIPSIFNSNISTKSGYCFAVFLCNSDEGRDGTSVYGKNTGITKAQADINEENYICYAWPVEVGRTGNRVYAISPEGTIMQNPNYGPNPVSGLDRPPKWCAAIHGSKNWKTGNFVKPGQIGQDTDLPAPWTPIG